MVLHFIMGPGNQQTLFLDTDPTEDTMIFYAGKSGFGHVMHREFRHSLIEKYNREVPGNTLIRKSII